MNKQSLARIKNRKFLLRAGAAFLLLAGALSNSAMGQGCVAAHTNQPIISGLSPKNAEAMSAHHQDCGIIGTALHKLTVTTSFRTYSSYKHYVGTVYQAQRAALQNQVLNHVNLYDVNLSYELSPRWSIIADLPGMTATRHQQGNVNTYRVGGIGDITAGVQAWVFRPPTEHHGNVAFTMQLKMPTGINDAQGTTIQKNGTTQVRNFDQSIQPGDGAWGFSLGTEAYRQTYLHTVLYFTGSWLFNPQDTNGVLTFRSAPHEDVMSVTDQYLWRGGFSHYIPKVRGLNMSLGGRMEGVPVRDAFGASNGFRRPGYVISLEPGFSYTYKGSMLNVSAPWALERNRKISTADMINHSHGDAAFADYTIIASVTKRF